MATFVVRAAAIVDAAIDGTASAAQKNRIANAAILYRPDLLILIAADPNAPTAEEKAEVFITTLKEWGQHWLSQTAVISNHDANEVNAQSDGAAAALDF
jgi:hypothetical protein